MARPKNFDERCYTLRYQEEETYAEIAKKVKSDVSVVKRAIKRHHRKEFPDTPLPRIRCGKVLEGNQRGARAHRLLNQGCDSALVAKMTGYSSREEAQNGAKRHSAATGAERAGRNAGEYAVQLKKGRATVVISRKAIRRAGWESGDRVLWNIADAGVLLFPIREGHIPSVAKTGDKGADAYHLRFREEKPWEEVGALIGLSAGGACNAAKTFAKAKGLPWLVKAKAGATEGVVRVVDIRQADGFAVTLIIPIETLGWKPGDVIRWKFEKPDRIRLSLARSSQAPVA